MKAINITAFTDDPSQIEEIKAVIKSLKIKYQISTINEPESPYNPDFVKMIRQGEKDIKSGKGIGMTIDEMENLCK
ncbi:MAG: hypothetical protein K9H26_18645 [Prolixibacteraceae bacterium]|nr:hypothetical protein [Prolixibacteraceae bacterium]